MSTRHVAIVVISTYQPKGIKMLVERVSNLDFDKWDALRDAVDQLIENGTYQRLAGIHSDHQGPIPIHRSPLFLPWHRAYLIILERELQAIDNSLSIPYWDWNADGGELRGFSDFLGLSGGRNLGTRPAERRQLGRSEWFTTEAQIQNILSQTNYADFTNALEREPHNNGHVWVGGDMASFESPKDPAFWLHHAQVDRIWALWQQDHPDEIADLSGDAARLNPWGDEFTVSSVNNISNIGEDSYEYVEPGEKHVHFTTLQGHTDGITGLAFSTDGSQLASSSRDGTIRLWNGRTGGHLRTINAHNGRVHSVAFSPGRSELASVGDNTVREWNTNTGRCNTYGEHRYAVTVAYHPQGHTLASGSSGSAAPNTIRLWDCGSKRLKRTLEGHTDSVTSVAWSPNGRRIASGSYDQTIRLWNPNNGRRIATLRGHTAAVFSVAFSPNGRLLASGSYDQTIRLWDMNTRQTIYVLRGPGGNDQVRSVAFDPDGHILASGHLHGSNLHLWNPSTGRYVKELTGHTWNVLSSAFSPDGILASGGGNDDTVRLWTETTDSQTS